MTDRHARLRITYPVASLAGRIAEAHGITRSELIETWIAQVALVHSPALAAEVDKRHDSAISIAAALGKPQIEVRIKGA